jgi:hypothetical protein
MITNDKAPIQLSDAELSAALADDLVKMHIETGIDLTRWPLGLELVARHYHTELTLEKKAK